MSQRGHIAMRRRSRVRLGWWCTAFAAIAASMALAGTAASKPSESEREHWIGTWATAAQRPFPSHPDTFRNQTVRLIVRTSAGGARVRVRISNVFGDQPLVIGAAHVARRTAGAAIDPKSDRRVTFGGAASPTIAAHAMAVSDPVDFDVPALSDLAISLFLPDATVATTAHALAKQTSYVSPETGDATAAADLPVEKTITTWPFLTGVEVAASSRGAAIVAFGSSLTDGDGSTKDTNHRWPDVLAERLQRADPKAELGVLNEGIIGNRLLFDFESPRQAGGSFGDVFQKLGPALGQSGLARFERDVLEQPGVKYVILALGVNDILFPGPFIPESAGVTAESLIEGNRRLAARARENGIRVIGTTVPPFEDATFRNPTILFFTPEKEAVRQKVNAWIRSGSGFDAVIDFDAAVRDPSRPAHLLPAYDSGDHVHPNDAGYVATGNAISLALFLGPSSG